MAPQYSSNSCLLTSINNNLSPLPNPNPNPNLLPNPNNPNPNPNPNPNCGFNALYPAPSHTPALPSPLHHHHHHHHHLNHMLLMNSNATTTTNAANNSPMIHNNNHNNNANTNCGISHMLNLHHESESKSCSSDGGVNDHGGLLQIDGDQDHGDGDGDGDGDRDGDGDDDGDGDGDGDGDEDEDEEEDEDDEIDGAYNSSDNILNMNNQTSGNGLRPSKNLQKKKNRKKKKRYHRHSQFQIQEMERVFKECPHPDEKQRLELSRELKLDPRQVKFWFQNKRTQVKAQHERHDNAYLRTENDKLRAENLALRDAIANVTCPNCGGPASLSDGSGFDDQQLRVENVRLREEIDRISKIAAKHVGRPISTLNLSTTTSSTPTSTTLNTSSMPNNSNYSANVNTTQQGGPGEINNEMNHGSVSGTGFYRKVPVGGGPSRLTESERVVAAEVAMAAMEELTQVAHALEPLWALDPVSGILSLDYHVYRQRFPTPSPPSSRSHINNNNNNINLKSESTRDSALVMMDATSLVNIFMNVASWANMFCPIVSRALPVEVLAAGVANTQDGAMQIMYAEFQLPSPMVSTRESYFLRYSKRMSYNNSLWVVVDVSLESLTTRTNTSSIAPLIRCRRRPSGCIIEDMSNGYSKVTWVEHSEVDDRGVHRLYQPLVNSGLAFGAQRWLANLRRQCEAMHVANNLQIPTNLPTPDLVCPTLEGRRSLLKLAERMTNNFCGGVSASVAHTWITLSPSTNINTTTPNNNNTNITTQLNSSDLVMTSDDVRVLIRKSVDDPGRPPGVVLCAATSIWLPVAPSRVFDFLRDERFRMEWDILSNMGPVEEIVHVPKDHENGNCVSLLRVNGVSSNQPNMLILQECCAEESSYVVAYAPVDIAAMGAVLNGGDPDCVALLPSGFSILPDRPPGHHHVDQSNINPPHLSTTGSLLTVAFQILVDHVPTAKLSLGSVATVNNLISSTVLRLKNAIACDKPSR